MFFFQLFWMGGKGLCGTYLDTWVDKLEITDNPFNFEQNKHLLHVLLNGQWYNVGFSKYDETLKMLPIVDKDKKL